MLFSAPMNNPTTPLSILPDFANVQVLCVGDVMLDHFVYGSVERISPEAPIPVLKVSRETLMLGGAGNVVRNVAALGAHATLITVIGDDEPGLAISRLIKAESGLDASLIIVPGRQTSVKVRHIAGNQQMLRTDRETAEPIPTEHEDRICAAFEGELASAHVVVLSDYAKGVLTPRVIKRICAAARAQGKLVIADPKHVDFDIYRGVHILTPNSKELAAAAGVPVSDDQSVERTATVMLQRTHLDALLVTRSERGMTLLEQGKPALHLATEAREVYDVSGAGDTVIAAFSVAIGAGLSLANAAELANTAAAIVVGKAGTAVVRASELAQALKADKLRGAEAKVTPLEAALDHVATRRARGLKTGFTNGCFDLIHPGHVSLLKQARASCDRLIVGLNTDASVKGLKGPGRPINSEMARAIVLAALESVDLVILFDDQTPIKLIQAIRPDALVKGADYTREQVVGGDFVTSYGGRIVLAELTPGQSTTSIVDRMARPKP